MRNKNGKRIILEKPEAENYKRYLERIDLYKSFGYDIEIEREFILKKAQPLYGNILEVGTGKGYLAIALAKGGYKFTSIDISEEEQKFAQLNIKYLGLEEKIDFKVEDAEHLKFEDGSFDVIISVNTIHHLSNPFKVIDELIRVVASEGKIILSDFTKEGLETVDKVHMSDGRRHNFFKNNLGDIGNYLANKDFKIERHRRAVQEVLIAYHRII